MATIVEAERIVTERLGKGYSVAKIKGVWVIGHDSMRGITSAFGIVSPLPYQRNLDKAISDVKAI